MSLPIVNLGAIGRTAASLVSPRGRRPVAGQTPAGKTVTWHPRAGDLAQTGGAKFVATLGQGAQLFSARFSAKATNGSFRSGYELPPIEYAKVKSSPVDVRPQIKAKNAEHAGKTLVDVDQLGDLSSDQKAAATAFAHDIEKSGYFDGVDAEALARRTSAATEAVRTMVSAPTTFYGHPGATRRSFERPELLQSTLENPFPNAAKYAQDRLQQNPVAIAYKQIDDASLSPKQKTTAKAFADSIIRTYMSDFSRKTVELEDLAMVAKAAITLGKAI